MNRRDFITLLGGAAGLAAQGSCVIWKPQVKKPSTRSTGRWVTVT